MYNSSPLGISTLIQGILAYPKTTSLICCATLITSLYSNGNFSSPSSQEHACVAVQDGVPTEFRFNTGDGYTHDVSNIAHLPCEQTKTEVIPPVIERACTPIPPGWGQKPKEVVSKSKKLKKPKQQTGVKKKVVRKHKRASTAPPVAVSTGCLEDLR